MSARIKVVLLLVVAVGLLTVNLIRSRNSVPPGRQDSPRLDVIGRTLPSPGASPASVEQNFRDPSLIPGSQDPERPPPSLARLLEFDTPEREGRQKPTEVLQRLALSDGMTVADIGAGAGYFTTRFARAVAPRGRVFATDVEPDALRYLGEHLQSLHLDNVTLVYGYKDDCCLPAASVDLAFLCDVHAFAYPDAPYGYRKQLPIVQRFYRTVWRSLKPDGRLVILEQKKETKDRNGFKGVSAQDITKQLRDAGFQRTAQYDDLQDQYFLVFTPADNGKRP